MKLSDEILTAIRVKMLLIGHHQEIIQKLEAEAKELAGQGLDATKHYDINLESGEVTQHAAE